MAPRVAPRVPPQLVRLGRVLRPMDAEHIYSNPRAEFARLEQAGALHRLAPGLFSPVPDDRVGQDWRPPLEAVALGVAGVGGHTSASALMGVSAARIHGAIPRALNVAVVAVGRHRRALRLVDRSATIHFVRRDVGRLDLELCETELGSGWMTTVEQTVIDLVARPHLGGVDREVDDAIGSLLPRCDMKVLAELADRQRRRGAVQRMLSAYGVA